MAKNLSINHIVEFEYLSSTNQLAQHLLHEGKPLEGTMIVAHFQRSGQGMGTNAWESMPGENLLMSMILYPDFIEPARQFLLHKISSLAVMETVRFFAPEEDILIKWPNDIYAGQKKIAGILTKNTILGNSIQSTILGIGLNVNQCKFSDALPNPVSLKLLTHKTIEIRLVLDKLNQQLTQYYDLLRQHRIVQIDELYLKHLLNFDVEAKYKANRKVFKGKICDVTEFGRLQVMHRGQISEFDIKEIEYIF